MIPNISVQKKCKRFIKQTLIKNGSYTNKFESIMCGLILSYLYTL